VFGFQIPNSHQVSALKMGFTTLLKVNYYHMSLPRSLVKRVLHLNVTDRKFSFKSYICGVPLMMMMMMMMTVYLETKDTGCSYNLIRKDIAYILWSLLSCVYFSLDDSNIIGYDTVSLS